MPLPDKRVVITGVGAISALGHNAASTWEGLLAGRTGAVRIEAYRQSDLPSQIACVVPDFRPEPHLSSREAKRLGRVTLLAVVAAEEAIADAHLDLKQEDPTRVGIEIGSAFGALDIVEEESYKVTTQGPRAVNATRGPAVLITTTPCYLAIRYGIQGPVNSP
ncbi:MAG: hypothetical protein N2383_10815, partial [Caldilineales bacterium]|nr:hypothetical protein [Caldilineales bacterium]